jgi:methyltransferase (TIGR00027 family)
VVDEPLILVDPVVGRLVGVPESEAEAACDRPRRLFFAARARFAEDRIADSAAAGVGQVVVLGAGMDTFADRNPHPGVRVFEVDHPATQAWKRRRLSEAGIAEAATFVPMDFEKDSLAESLAAAGFDRERPAVFTWLGVVYYLTSDALRATLDYIAGQAPPSTVVFDYLTQPDTEPDRADLQRRADRLAAAGEPWNGLLTPDSVAAELRDHGFSDLDDRSAVAVVGEYCDGPSDVEVLRPSRIVAATVSGPRAR